MTQSKLFKRRGCRFGIAKSLPINSNFLVVEHWLSRSMLLAPTCECDVSAYHAWDDRDFKTCHQHHRCLAVTLLVLAINNNLLPIVWVALAIYGCSVKFSALYWSMCYAPKLARSWNFMGWSWVVRQSDYNLPAARGLGSKTLHAIWCDKLAKLFLDNIALHRIELTSWFTYTVAAIETRCIHIGTVKVPVTMVDVPLCGKSGRRMVK
jgi:hypothetical protein